MNPFQPMTYYGCANPKKRFKPIGKYAYDVFYTLDSVLMTGYTRGDNQKHARGNFFLQYAKRAKIKHFQRLSIGS